ncbi:MAG TPA: Kdo hydroxylase family protein, partial [Acidobacteriota bacterium]
MTLIRIENYRHGLTATEDNYRRLETGDILFFVSTPFELTSEERAFLLSQKQTDVSYHKNISYRPLEDRLKGMEQRDENARWRLHEIMRSYSRRVIDFTASFLPRYAGNWRIDYASFRPVEEEGRAVALHARNDLIHVDSFPTRPSDGNRLLRIFTNI